MLKNSKACASILHTDNWSTVRENQGYLGAQYSGRLREDLGIKMVADKFVPQAMTDNQKEWRTETTIIIYVIIIK